MSSLPRRYRTVPRGRGALPRDVIKGQICGFDGDGWPLVLVGEERVSARSTVALAVADIGREVLVVAELTPPVIVGVLQPPLGTPIQRVIVDGASIVVTAEHDLVLSCGAASLTLTRAGKVLIKGEYVLTRASGVNRIKGGSVQIN